MNNDPKPNKPFALHRIGLFVSLGIAVGTAALMYRSIGSYDLLGAVIVSNALNLLGFFVFIGSLLIENRSPAKSKSWMTAFILAALVLVPYWAFVFGWSGNIRTWM